MAQSEAQRRNLEKGKAHQFTAETAAEAGRKGQEASVRKRRELKTMRECLRELGKLRCSDEQVAAFLEKEGFSASKIMAASLRVAQKAELGDLEAYKVFRDGLGESPKMSVELAVEPGTAEELRQLSDAQLAEIASKNDSLED